MANLEEKSGDSWLGVIAKKLVAYRILGLGA
jgi:hypothetical protein